MNIDIISTYCKWVGAASLLIALLVFAVNLFGSSFAYQSSDNSIRLGIQLFIFGAVVGAVGIGLAHIFSDNK